MALIFLHFAPLQLEWRQTDCSHSVNGRCKADSLLHTHFSRARRVTSCHTAVSFSPLSHHVMKYLGCQPNIANAIIGPGHHDWITATTNIQLEIHASLNLWVNKISRSSGCQWGKTCAASTNNKHDMNRPKQRSDWLIEIQMAAPCRDHQIEHRSYRWARPNACDTRLVQRFKQATVATKNGCVGKWGNPNSLWHCQCHLSGQIHKSVYPHYFPTVFHLILGWFKPIKLH